MDLSTLPDDPIKRLEAYRRARALEEERERVFEALKKEPKDRGEGDWVALAYSPLGYASRCGY